MKQIKIFISFVWNKYLRYIYSKLLFVNDVNDYDICENIQSLSDINNIVNNINNIFIYKKDFIDEIHTPAQCYKNYHDNNFYDDCDGFHSAVYHILSKNNIEQWLITQVFTNMQGHTFLLFKYIGLYGIIDYKNIKFGIVSQKYINNILKYYKYDDGEYMYHYIWKWDYEKKKYVNCKESEL